MTTVIGDVTSGNKIAHFQASTDMKYTLCLDDGVCRCSALRSYSSFNYDPFLRRVN